MDARLIVDPPASGTWNMAVDEALFQLCQCSRQITVRFYEWSEPTLSLGYFQPAHDRELHISSRNCPLVRRSTGGGAIVHDRELTYSLVVPLMNDRSAKSQELVRIVHQSLIAALESFGVIAQFRDDSDVQSSELSEELVRLRHDPTTPILKSEHRSPKTDPFLCFQRQAPDDLFIGEHKIAGSAQRKLHRTLLQHGSVLLGRSAAAPELPGIGDLVGLDLSARRLAESWTDHLTERLSLHGSDFVTFTPVSGEKCPLRNSIRSADEDRLVREIEQQKFATNQWNRKR